MRLIKSIYALSHLHLFYPSYAEKIIDLCYQRDYEFVFLLNGQVQGRCILLFTYLCFFLLFMKKFNVYYSICFFIFIIREKSLFSSFILYVLTIAFCRHSCNIELAFSSDYIGMINIRFLICFSSERTVVNVYM